MYRACAWLVWTASAAVAALLTHNPLYLTLIALASWLIHVTTRYNTDMTQSWHTLLTWGLFIWLITVPFNALMVHRGDHVLFVLPGHWPLIGGRITLEAVVCGLVSGFSLWVLLLILSTFHLAVDASQLLRLTPAFFYQAGVVACIALTFIPQMVASAKEIREAQRIRGHRFRGWRDILPLLVPLLTTALERAIGLAEAMESRGFGGQLTTMTARERNGLRVMTLLSLVLLIGGFFVRRYLSRFASWGLPLSIVALLIIFYVFHVLGSRVERSHYRRARWQRQDTAIVLSSLGALAGFLFVRMVDKMALVYHPYPPYSLVPPFDGWIGLLLTLLAIPALIVLFGNREGTSGSTVKGPVLGGAP
ncbi:MAG: energy-coupling factor transporter transmembrane component T [Anaerolineales bacterium]